MGASLYCQHCFSDCLRPCSDPNEPQGGQAFTPERDKGQACADGCTLHTTS